MKKIRRITENVNGNKEVYFPFNDRKHLSLAGRLRDEYMTQGNFYREVFNVSEEDAERAGWHPKDKDFTDSSSHWACEGWSQFLQDKGEVRKTLTEELVDIEELLFCKE